MRLSPRTLAAILAGALIALGLRFLFAPAPPAVASAGPDAGRADRDDDVATADGLKILVRTPSDYDPTRAYPLLMVYPPAGYDRRASEIFYGLTTEATRRGFIIAFSDHLSLSTKAAERQGKAAATVAEHFCVDPSSIAYLGHSDGGAIAEAVPAFALDASFPPRAIVASAAGVALEDLVSAPCPLIPDVLIIHNRNDDRFPDFGRHTAAYWGSCGRCGPGRLGELEQGCREFPDCAPGRRVAYCESSEPHKNWPQMNDAILDFLQGRPIRPDASRPE